jgi:hypothetical protein
MVRQVALVIFGAPCTNDGATALLALATNGDKNE